MISMDQGGNVWTLAHVPGRHMPPQGGPKTPAHLLCAMDLSRGRLCLRIVASDGRMMGEWGSEEGDEAESMLLKAWYNFRVPPYLWKVASAEEARTLEYPIADAKERYEAARSRLDTVVSGFRITEFSRSKLYKSPEDFEKDRMFYPDLDAK